MLFLEWARAAPELALESVVAAAQSKDGKVIGLLQQSDSEEQSLAVCARGTHELQCPPFMRVSASSFIFKETRGVPASYKPGFTQHQRDSPFRLTLLCTLFKSSLTVFSIAFASTYSCIVQLELDSSEACLLDNELEVLEAFIPCADREVLLHLALNEQGWPRIKSRLPLLASRGATSWLCNGSTLAGLCSAVGEVKLWQVSSGRLIARLALPPEALNLNILDGFQGFGLCLRNATEACRVQLDLAVMYASEVHLDLMPNDMPSQRPTLNFWSALEPWPRRIMVSNSFYQEFVSISDRCIVRQVSSIRDICVDGSLSDEVCEINAWSAPSSLIAMREALGVQDWSSAGEHLALVQSDALPRGLGLIPSYTAQLELQPLLELARKKAVTYLAAHTNTTDSDVVACEVKRLRPALESDSPVVATKNDSLPTALDSLRKCLTRSALQRWESLPESQVAAEGVRLGRIAAATAVLSSRGTLDAFAQLRDVALARAYVTIPVSIPEARRFVSQVGLDPDSFLKQVQLHSTHRRVRTALCQNLPLSREESLASHLLDELEGVLPGSSYSVAIRRAYSAGNRFVTTWQNGSPALNRRRWPRFGPSGFAVNPAASVGDFVLASSSASRSSSLLQPGDVDIGLQPLKDPSNAAGAFADDSVALALDVGEVADPLTAMLKLPFSLLLGCSNADFIRIEAGLHGPGVLAFAVAHNDMHGTISLAETATRDELRALVDRGPIAEHILEALNDKNSFSRALRRGSLQDLERFSDALNAAGAVALLPLPHFCVDPAWADHDVASEPVADADPAREDSNDSTDSGPLLLAPELLLGRPVSALRSWIITGDSAYLDVLPPLLAEHLAVCFHARPPVMQSHVAWIDAFSSPASLCRFAIATKDPLLAQAATLLEGCDVDECALAMLLACDDSIPATSLFAAADALLVKNDMNSLRRLARFSNSAEFVGKLAEFCLWVRACHIPQATPWLESLPDDVRVLEVVRTLVREALDRPSHLDALLSVLADKWPGEFGLLHRRAQFSLRHGISLQPVGDVVGVLLQQGDFAGAKEAVLELIGDSAVEVRSRVSLAHARALTAASHGDLDVWEEVVYEILSDCDPSLAADFFLEHGQAEMAARVAVAANMDPVRRLLAHPDSSLAIGALGAKPKEAVDALLANDRLHEATQVAKLLRVEGGAPVVDFCHTFMQSAREGGPDKPIPEGALSSWPGARSLLARASQCARTARALGVGFDLVWAMDAESKEEALMRVGRVDLVTSPSLLAQYVGDDQVRARDVAAQLGDEDCIAVANLLSNQWGASSRVFWQRAGQMSRLSLE